MKEEKNHRLYFPPVGQRIIKTGVAVTLCLMFYALRGYRGQDMSAEAAITAIICMQPYVHDTREYSLNRIAGTLIGAFWGLLFLTFISFFPAIGRDLPVLYVLMGVGIVVSLYSAVFLRMPDTSSLAAIVFICVVIAYPDIEEPLLQVFHRILDVIVGTTVAIAVNVLRMPRRFQSERVFFVRTKDLVPDQMSQISPTVLYHLTSLYNKGAKICLISEHAPAFLMSQLNSIKWTMPMIVMDGAAVYDAGNNTYLSSVPIAPKSTRWLMKRLDGMGVSYFIYTIHKDRNCIYHHGALTQSEQKVYEHLRRSPYRLYLDDDRFDLSEVVYIKIVTGSEHALSLERLLRPMLAKEKLRAAIRPQDGTEDQSSLYLYAEDADPAHAQARLMRMMRRTDPGLSLQNVFLENGYHSEHDAIHVLHRVTRSYERPLISLRKN
ncbi:MAG: FUSC family protein [Clostridia bacterium]|nr:FUSC family protein [Clostridia bacterium]